MDLDPPTPARRTRQQSADDDAESFLNSIRTSTRYVMAMAAAYEGNFVPAAAILQDAGLAIGESAVRAVVRYVRRTPEAQSASRPLQMPRRAGSFMAEPVSMNPLFGAGVARSTPVIGNGRMGDIPVPRKRARITPCTTSRMRSDRNFEVEQTGCAWFGMKSFDRGEMFRMVAQHISQLIFLRIDSYPSAYHQIPDALKVPTLPQHAPASLSKIEFVFSGDLQVTAGTTQVSNQQVDWVSTPAAAPVAAVLDNWSFDDFVTHLQAELVSKAKTGYVLTRIRGYRGDMSSPTAGLAYRNISHWFDMRDVDRRIVDVVVKCKSKLQNVTPASDGADPLHSTNITANTLVGRCTHFKTPTPRFRQTFIDGYQSTAGPVTGAFISQIQATSADDIIVPALQNTTGTGHAFRVGGLANGVLVDQFSQPMRSATSIFQGQTGTVPVAMQPGGFTSMNRTFTYGGRLGQLCLGLYGANGVIGPNAAPVVAGSTYASVGECDLLCLEHSVRSGAKATLPIKLVVNYDLSYTMDSVPIKKRPLPVKTQVV